MKYPAARLVHICVLLLLVIHSSLELGIAQPSFAWATRMGDSSGADFVNSIAVDRNGNSIVAGYFYGYSDFGVTNLSAPNFGYPETFVAKYDREGRLLWARSSGFYYSDIPRAVAVDSAGDAFVVGTFSNSGTFGHTNLNSFGGDDVFVAKYDPDGRLVWVLQLGGNSTDYTTSVATDSIGNFYVGGYFYGTANFGGVSISPTAGADAYLAKYDNNGQLIWVRSIHGNSFESVTSVAVDQVGNPYVTGNFQNTVMIGTTCLFSSSGNDIFLAKFDADGNSVWAKQAGGNGDDMPNSMVIDNSSNVFVTGYFSGTAIFGDTNLYSQSYDMFIAKYNSTGNVQWARRAGSGNNDYGRGIAVDTNGNAFVTGQFYNTIDFGTTNLTRNLNEDIFVARYDVNGNVAWAISAGGGNNAESGYGISVDEVGNCFVVGQFSGNATFGTTNLYGYSGSSDGFVMKLLRDLPVIALQPTNTIVMESAAVAFVASAIGTGPFRYQWQFKGNNIPNATNSVLSRSNVVTNDSGTYRLLVSNYEGTVSTIPVTLTVLTLSEAVNAPGLVWTSGGDFPWFNQTNFTHDGVTAARSGAITNSQQSWIETSVSGPARVTFYWKVSSENGYDVLAFLVNGIEQTNISGKIDWKELSFLLPTGSQRLRWAYSKDESESVGQDSGWLDQVRIVYTPSILTGPQDVTTIVTSNITLTASTAGTLPINYRWFRDGNPVGGATDQILSITNIQPDQAGAYRLVASNSAGSATTDVAVVTVHIPPHITGQPAQTSVSPGEPATFTVTATSQSVLSYQWRLNGTNISGATGASLVVSNPRSADVGVYDVIISSAIGTTISGPARLTLIDMAVLPVVVIEGSAGSSYRIDYKTTVEETGWSTVDYVTVPGRPFYYLDVSGRGQPHRFYRVVPLP